MKIENIYPRKDIVHNQEKAYDMVNQGLLDTVGGLLAEKDEVTRKLASQIFATISNHNVGRRAALKFIPTFASLFEGKFLSIIAILKSGQI